MYFSFAVVSALAVVSVQAKDDVKATRRLNEKNASRSLGVGAGPRNADVCFDKGLPEMSGDVSMVLSTIPRKDGVIDGLNQYQQFGLGTGSITALIPEASDAAVSGAPVVDGESGDIDFPFGKLKPIATVGERSVCDSTFGQKTVGVPDGLGAYLVDDETIRVVVQSESYGPLRFESYPFFVNDGAASIGGSHIQYTDYLREEFSEFMTHELPASFMITGMGNLIEYAYNLKGEPLGPRNGEDATTVGAHYGNTDAAGVYTVEKIPAEADWFYQSLCSAHLEEKHQWGEGIGVEDDLFITNEESINYDPSKEFVGIGYHALDLASKSLYAIGSMTLGGFEKSVEINPQSPDYVIFAISGYNGNFESMSRDIPQTTLDLRNAEYTRSDGKPYVWSKDIVPYRIYVGMKGKLADGSDAPADDFLARNGLKYGQVYGFAIDMTNTTGPTLGVWRDEFHKSASNGDLVEGKWVAQEWRWDGVVKNFQHDGSWDYQSVPPGAEEGGAIEGYHWWMSAGPDKNGCKTEHLSSDPREGLTAFVQGSTCGYFGHAYVDGVPEALAEGGFPDMFDGRYYVYQGETDITAQVELGGKGEYTEGRDATRNWDTTDGEGKVTFEDIDGLEVFEASDGLYVMIQEDSGNDLGERMFISSPLEHEADGNDLKYYFVAMSGGSDNTRMTAGVGIPAGVSCGASSHEFSGLFDASGLVRKDENGEFGMSASDTGYAKRTQDRLTAINDKYIISGLQAHNYACGVIGAFQGDRGGQWLLYQPNIPV